MDIVTIYCAMDAPEIDPARGYEPTPEGGLWIDSGAGPANDEAASKLPKPPEGCFVHWFFIHDWNRFIHVCGANAVLEWTETGPLPARGATRALLPGDEV